MMYPIGLRIEKEQTISNPKLVSSDAALHTDTLARDTKVPIYHQLYERLRDKILLGEWQNGDLVPPEPALMSQYGVSRITVRQAIEKLVHENLVYRQRGRGTFVRNPIPMRETLRLTDLEGEMRRRGIPSTTQVVAVDIVAASRITAQRLNIPAGGELAMIRRLWLSNGEPLCLEENFFAYKYCPGLLEGHDYAVESPYTVLEQQYNIRMERAEQTVSAMTASQELSALLNTPVDTALLYQERILYSQLDLPVEYWRAYFRSDQYAMQYELRR